MKRRTPFARFAPLAVVTWTLGMSWACDAEDAPGAAGADSSAPEVRDEVAGDPDTAVADTTPPEVIGPTAITVGPRACCLAMEGDLMVWSDDGDLFMWDQAKSQKEPLVIASGVQKDPILSGGTLVWSDNRGGDFDLWTMQLVPTRGEPRLLRGGAGDQEQPAIDGTHLVWIGRERAPYTAREAEVFTMDLAVAGSERQLTSDEAEQTQVDVSGARVVWADFVHSPDQQYIDLADPLRNNADILGWDLESDAAFVVTADTSKQLRPAIDGETVVWLDWRGINPEPKYSEFQVFVRRIGDVGPQAERRLAWSSWSRPELWRRPAVHDGVVVFIAEPSVPGAGYVTGLLAVEVAGGEPWLVAGSSAVLDSVAVGEDEAAFVGAGAIGRVRLDMQGR